MCSPRIDVKMTSIYSSDRESGEELMRRLEVLKGLKATGQLEEEDRRGLLLSPPREEIGLLERQRQRIKKIQESKQDTAEGTDERKKSRRRRRRREDEKEGGIGKKEEEEPTSLGRASPTVKKEEVEGREHTGSIGAFPSGATATKAKEGEEGVNREADTRKTGRTENGSGHNAKDKGQGGGSQSIGPEDKKGGGCRGAAGSLGTTPTPKTEKIAPKKRVRAKKEEVLTDQPDFDPPESDGSGK